MKKVQIILTTILASVAFNANATDIKVTSLTADQMPAEAEYKGNFVNAVTWKDKTGVHYVVQSETPLLMTKEAKAASQPFRIVDNEISGEKDTIMNYELVEANGQRDTIWNLEADYRVKGLFAYHYINKKGTWSQEWKNMDNINQCSYKNLTAEYLTEPIITDLDDDKTAEVWLVYRLGCRQFKYTPLGMREIVYIGQNRAAVNGLQFIKRGEKMLGGENKPDDQFKGLPQSIKEFGKTLWLKYAEEKVD